MYQLSHLLIEQRNILSTLQEENSVDDSKNLVSEEQEDGNKLANKTTNKSNSNFDIAFHREQRWSTK